MATVLHLINYSFVDGGAQKILKAILNGDKTQMVFSSHECNGFCKASFFRWFFQLFRLVHQQRPSVIVAHYRYYIPIAVFFKYLYRVKIIFVCHSQFPKHKWLLNCFRFDCYVAISNSVEQYLGSINQKLNVVRIDNGVSVSKEAETANGSDHPYVFSYVGGLYEAKGVDVAIRALSNLCERTGHDVDFHVVGQGPELDALQKIKTSESLHIHWHGFNKNPWLVVRNIRNIIIPSKYEGFCLVIAEAIIAKKKVFASDLPVLREVASGVRAVTYFNTGSYESLACEIIENMQRNDNQDLIYEEASELIRNRYSEAVMQRKYQKLFNSMAV